MDKLDTIWPKFMAALYQRMLKGRNLYGDLSFRAKPAVLLDEIEQECLDLAGWAFILWSRVRDVLPPTGTIAGGPMPQGANEEAGP